MERKPLIEGVTVINRPSSRHIFGPPFITTTKSTEDKQSVVKQPLKEFRESEKVDQLFFSQITYHRKKGGGPRPSTQRLWRSPLVLR